MARERQFNLKLSPVEMARLEKLAKHYGISKSDVCRMIVKREDRDPGCDRPPLARQRRRRPLGGRRDPDERPEPARAVRFQRRERFLKLGRAVMKDLAKLVGVDPKEVCVNPAGCAVSGDVYAYSSDSFLYVNFSQTKMGVDAFLVRCGDTSLWMKWEELLDLPKLAEKVAALLVIERTEES